MTDITLTCRDCQREFAWTAGEQEFYRTKGLKKPVFCPICRGRHKARERQFAPYQKKEV